MSRTSFSRRDVRGAAAGFSGHRSYFGGVNLAASANQIGRVFAVLGAFLLFAGLFAPILAITGGGEITFWRGAASKAAVIAFLAFLSAILAFSARVKQVFWTGVASSVLLLVSYTRIDQVRDQFGTGGESPVTLGQAVIAGSTLQWGWLPLGLGAGLLLLAGWLTGFAGEAGDQQVLRSR